MMGKKILPALPVCMSGGCHKVKDIVAIDKSAIYEDKIIVGRNKFIYRTYRFRAICVKCNCCIVAEDKKEFEGHHA